MGERYGGRLDTHLVTNYTFGVGSLFKETTWTDITPENHPNGNLFDKHAKASFLANKKCL